MPEVKGLTPWALTRNYVRTVGTFRRDAPRVCMPVANYERMLIRLCDIMQAQCEAEECVLVDVLHAPEHLWLFEAPHYKMCVDGKVLKHVIRHCHAVLEQNNEEQCTAVLTALCRMAVTAHLPARSDNEQVDEYRQATLRSYFGQTRVQEMRGTGTRLEMSPEEKMARKRRTQDKLNDAGAAKLIIDLIEQCDGAARLSLLAHVLEFAKALLDGGNTHVQVCMRVNNSGNALLQTSIHECMQKSCTEHDERSAISVISRRLHDAMPRLIPSGDSRPVLYRIRPSSSRDATANVTPAGTTPLPEPLTPLVSTVSRITPTTYSVQTPRDRGINSGLAAPVPALGSRADRRNSFRRQHSVRSYTDNMLAAGHSTTVATRRRSQRSRSQRRAQDETLVDDRNANEMRHVVPP